MKFLANADSEVQICFTVAAVCRTILFPAPIFFLNLDDKKSSHIKTLNQKIQSQKHLMWYRVYHSFW